MRVIGILLVMAGIFGLGYYTGVSSAGSDPVDVLKKQIKEITSTIFRRSSAFKREFSLHQSLNKAEHVLVEAKENILNKNFGKALNGIDEALILLTDVRTSPDTHNNIDMEIDALRARLLAVHDAITNLKPDITSGIDSVTDKIEQLRDAASSR